VISRVYPIIDADYCHTRQVDPLSVAAACVRGGATLLQVRSKDTSSARLVDLAERIVSIAHAGGAKVIVNDRADIARMAGADGVHVGQTDLSVPDVRRILGAQAIVGLSTHDPAQVDDALQQDVSYVAVGPIYSTTTKDTGYSARGLELVRYAANRGKPVVAIGGITLERAAEVAEAGADMLAVISDILVGNDPEHRVRDFLDRLPPQPFKVY
jgi:thiamine-phosphate pyrophosphorylase